MNRAIKANLSQNEKRNTQNTKPKVPHLSGKDEPAQERKINEFRDRQEKAKT